MTVRNTNRLSAAVRIVVALLGMSVAVGVVAVNGWHALATFTVQSNLMVGVSSLWTAYALLARRRTPPEWLDGSAVFYITITGAVYNFVINPGSFGSQQPVLLGLSASDVVHVVTPVAALVVWIVFAEHHRIPWKYTGIWLVYLVAYLVAVLVFVAVLPDFSAPYPFLDIEAHGVAGVSWRLALFMVFFAALSAALIAIDRFLLPKRTILSEYDPHDQ